MQKPLAKVLGTLPKGEWTFGVILMQGQADVILVIDRSGKNAPLIVIGDRLQEIE